MQTFTPHVYQSKIIAHIQSIPRCAVWAGMGTGKTVSTLTALQSFKESGETLPVLILAPKRVAAHTWTAEAALWEHLQGFVVRSLVADSAAKRMKLLKAALADKADAFAINYESFEWLLGALATLAVAWPFGTVVADEASKLRGLRGRQGTKRAHAIWLASKPCKRFIQLTGTPASKGLESLYGQLYALDSGARLGRTYTNYMETYFKGFALNMTVTLWTPLPGATEKVMERCKDVCISVQAEDYFSVDKPQVININVPLPAAALVRYKEMAADAITEVGGSPLVALNSAVLKGKLLQMASGTAYTPERETVVLHDAKLEALDSLIEELSGEPLIVFYTYKADHERLLARYPQARELKTAKDLADWNAGKIDLLLLQPASAGHGLSLQHGGRNMCFYSPMFDAELWLQARERCGPLRQMQSGYKRVVREYYLLAEGTVDPLAMAALQGKEITQADIMALVK